MSTKKIKHTPFTVAIMGWSIYTMSGTGTLLRTLLYGLHTTTQIRFLLVLPDIPSANSKNIFDNTKYERQWDTLTIPKTPSMGIATWLQHAYQAVATEANVIFYPDSITLAKDQKVIAKKNLSVTLLHDLIPLSLPEYYLNPFKYFPERKKFNHISKHSDYIVTISKYSLAMIQKKLGVVQEKLQLIYNGVDYVFTQNKKPLTSWLSRSGILYVGDLRRRKNVLTLVNAYLDLPPEIQNEHPLILVADGKLKTTINKLCRTKQIIPQFYSELNTTELKSIYTQAKIMIFPSLLEGFGLPVIEAQCCGTPVICGDHSSLGEITRSPDGESALYVNVKKPDEIKTAILTLLSDEDKYLHYQRLGLKNSNRFTANKMIQAYQSFFTELAKKPNL